jgi:hypothetical protein
MMAAQKTGTQRRAVLSAKVTSEMRELHARTQRLAESARGRSGRREAREAREAEADFLRFLGFDTYDEFDAAAAKPSEAPRAQEKPDTRTVLIDELRVRVGQLEEELAEATHEIRRVRSVRTDGLADARAALFEAAAQLTAIYEEVLRDRAEIDIVLEEARASARAITDAAREQATMMIREAAVTIAGLGAIAAANLQELS